MSDNLKNGVDRCALAHNPSQRTPSDVILVTGASGFIGSAIVAKLRAQGASLRILVRKTANRRNINSQDTLYEGDMRDRAAVARAMAGVTHFLHVAADYRLWARNPEEIFSTNVDGTKIVMEEALRAGVKRIVYTSSVATLALQADKSNDERNRQDIAHAIGAYKKSKILAEQLVESMIERNDLPAVIVNPSTPIGPRDIRPTPTGRIIVEAANGRMPAFVDTGLNLVHVDDVAASHIAALERGRIGERYILGGENVALVDLLASIARKMGRRPPTRRLPHNLVYPAACGAELMAYITGREPFVSRDSLRLSKDYMFFDDAKARRELGHKSRPYAEAVADALHWFKEMEYVK